MALCESELLMWKNPLQTGLVVAGSNGLFLLVFMMDLSVTPLLCNIGFLSILVGAAVKLAAPSLAEQSVELMSKETIHAAVEVFAKVLDALTIQARDIILWTDTYTTVKALVVLQIARQIAPFVSLMFVVFLSGNLLFSVPYALEAYKTQIDTYIEPHLKTFRMKRDEILAKVPKYTEGKDE
eukprot:TRINITY_DN8541_c0_g1_i1.p1 TRINITY_DN8541_c0_g1~~TRINITY_DN8541_c0_g1_i1.p1  ORF type:complete len:182 (+),score=39.14 TRINITY_DN8541_c0_g1_i1:85-630(+)